MKAAFVCWRPYQVFNAINMVYNDTEKTKGCSDLYIQDLPALKAMVPYLEETNLFNNIYLFTELNHGDSANVGAAKQLKIYLVRTKNFVLAHSALKRNCHTLPEGGFRQYDLLLASGWISFFIEMANCNPKARVVLFEDGTASYVYDQIAQLPPIRKKYYGLLKALFRKGPLCVNVSALYVNNPAMMMGTRPYPVRQLRKMDDELFKLLCQIHHFDATDETYKNKKLIFLGQPLGSANEPDYSELEIVKKLLQDRDLVYRKHPLQRDLEVLDCEDQKRPLWELVCRGLDSSYTLIAQFSTAQLTPYMLYGNCPKLVFLYKFSYKADMALMGNFRDMIQAVKESYPNEIYEPETLEEFYEIMRGMK